MRAAGGDTNLASDAEGGRGGPRSSSSAGGGGPRSNPAGGGGRDKAADDDDDADDEGRAITGGGRGLAESVGVREQHTEFGVGQVRKHELREHRLCGLLRWRAARSRWWSRSPSHRAVLVAPAPRLETMAAPTEAWRRRSAAAAVATRGESAASSKVPVIPATAGRSLARASSVRFSQRVSGPRLRVPRYRDRPRALAWPAPTVAVAHFVASSPLPAISSTPFAECRARSRRRRRRHLDVLLKKFGARPPREALVDRRRAARKTCAFGKNRRRVFTKK